MLGQPKYLRVVDRLAEEIRSGQLVPGSRIDAHRELATRFGVTISTVTRAVAEAQQRGLVVARPGSGTFVLGPEFAGPPPRVGAPIDLRHNGAPMPAAVRDGLEAALREVARDGGAASMFGSHVPERAAAHRAGARTWLRLRGLEADDSEILFSHGAQHGLSACLTALAPPGSTVLAEPWIYAGFRRLAAASGVTLAAVALDQDGMRPDALDAALAATGSRLILCSPAAQNPTTITMPATRRREIIDIVRRHDALVLEDDVFGHLAGDTEPPLAGIGPDRVAYVTGLSKSIAPGMRLGIVRLPRALVPRVQEALGIQHWVAPNMMGELFARMVANGSAVAAVESHRHEMRARLELAGAVLGPGAVAALRHPTYHLWLPVPPPWRLDDFVACLEERHVRVLPSGHFAVAEGQTIPRIRACLGNHDLDALRPALSVIAQVLLEPGRMNTVFI